MSSEVTLFGLNGTSNNKAITAHSETRDTNGTSYDNVLAGGTYLGDTGAITALRIAITNDSNNVVTMTSGSCILDWLAN